MKRILCIWLPAWPIQRLVIQRPELKGQPVILHTQQSRRGRCVVACSRAAYRAGVRPGMPIAEASALLPVFKQGAACPTRSAGATSQPTGATSQPTGATSQQSPIVYLARHQESADREVLCQLANDYERFSPRVGFERSEWDGLGVKGVSPSSVYLDITNLGEHFGGDDELARCVARFIEQRGYRARIGVADTLGAAWAAAHFGSAWATPLDSCHAADPDSNRWSRSSCWVIKPGSLQAALRPLPIEALRLNERTISSLHQLGVFQIHQLAALPRSGLAARYGQELLRRWDQALGVQSELLEPHRPAPVFEVRHDLEHPTHRWTLIHVILEQLVRRLCKSMAQAHQGVLELLCCCGCERTSEHDRSSARAMAAMNWQWRVVLVRPTASEDHLLELLRMQSERLKLPGALEWISLSAVVTGRLESHQQALFSEVACSAGRQLARMVDRLGSRLGRDGLVWPRLCADRQPERAWEYEPVVAQRPSSARGRALKKRATRDSVGNPRPLFLRSPPVALCASSDRPDIPPDYFYLEKTCHHIQRHWGPERIETGWWRGRSIRRDYFRVETRAGEHFWLFRQIEDGQWFLHGTFE